MTDHLHYRNVRRAVRQERETAKRDEYVRGFIFSFHNGDDISEFLSPLSTPKVKGPQRQGASMPEVIYLFGA